MHYNRDDAETYSFALYGCIPSTSGVLIACLDCNPNYLYNLQVCHSHRKLYDNVFTSSWSAFSMSINVWVCVLN